LGLAAKFRAHDPAFEKLGRGDVEQLGDFLTDAFERVGSGGLRVFSMALALQRLRPPPVRPRRGRLPALIRFANPCGARRVRSCLSPLRYGSRHVLEEQLELGGVEFFTLRSEEAPDKVVELGFEKGDFRVGGFKFGTQADAFSLKCFDTVPVAGTAPSTRFVILY
jgi:hypothetical protein